MKKIALIIALVLMCASGVFASTAATAYVQFLHMPYDGDTLQVGQDGPFPYTPITYRFTTQSHSPDPAYVDFSITSMTTLVALKTAFVAQLDADSGTTAVIPTADPNTEGGFVLTAANSGVVGNSNYLIAHVSFSHCFRLTSWAGGSN